MARFEFPDLEMEAEDNGVYFTIEFMSGDADAFVHETIRIDLDDPERVVRLCGVLRALSALEHSGKRGVKNDNHHNYGSRSPDLRSAIPGYSEFFYLSEFDVDPVGEYTTPRLEWPVDSTSEGECEAAIWNVKVRVVTPDGSYIGEIARLPPG